MQPGLGVCEVPREGAWGHGVESMVEGWGAAESRQAGLGPLK